MLDSWYAVGEGGGQNRVTKYNGRNLLVRLVPSSNNVYIYDLHTNEHTVVQV
jgi:hypothetical protein